MRLSGFAIIATAAIAFSQTVAVAQTTKDPNLRALKTQTSISYRTSTAIKARPYHPPARNGSAAASATHDLAKLEQQQAHVAAAKPPHTPPVARIKEPPSSAAGTQSFAAAPPRKKIGTTTTRARQSKGSGGYHSRFGR